MPFLQFTLDIGARDPEPYENALFGLGAHSVTLLDAADDPVLEPAPGPQNYAVALGASASPRGAQAAWARLGADGRVRADHSLYRTKGDQLTGPTVLKVGEDQPKLTQPLSLRVGGVNRRTGGAAPPAGV